MISRVAAIILSAIIRFYKGMTGFDGANGSLAASRGALTSQIQSKLTNANNGKAFTFPMARNTLSRSQPKGYVDQMVA